MYRYIHSVKKKNSGLFYLCMFFRNIELAPSLLVPGVMVYVDVRSGLDSCENRSEAVSHQLDALGATVSHLYLLCVYTLVSLYNYSPINFLFFAHPYLLTGREAEICVILFLLRCRFIWYPFWPKSKFSWTIIRHFDRNRGRYSWSFYSTVEGAMKLKFASFCSS